MQKDDLTDQREDHFHRLGGVHGGDLVGLAAQVTRVEKQRGGNHTCQQGHQRRAEELSAGGGGRRADEEQHHPKRNRAEGQEQDAGEAIFQNGMMDVRDVGVSSRARLPDELIPDRVGEGRAQDRQRAEQHFAQSRQRGMLHVDQQNAHEDDAREQQSLGGDLVPEPTQHQRRGQDGGLPGGGDDPACGILRAERDQRVEDAEADAACQDPEKPMTAEHFPHVSQRLFATRHEQDQDQKD